MLNAELDDLPDALDSQEMLDAPRGEHNSHHELPDRPSRVANEITDLSKMYTIDSSDEDNSNEKLRDYSSPGVPDTQVEVNDTDLTAVLRPLGTSHRKEAHEPSGLATTE